MARLDTQGARRLLAVLAAGGWVTATHRGDYLLRHNGQWIDVPHLRAAVLACERRGQIAGDGSGALTITATERADLARVQAAGEGRRCEN